MKIRSLLILAIAVLWPLAATAQINFPIGAIVGNGSINQGDPTEPCGPPRPDYWLSRKTNTPLLMGEGKGRGQPRQATNQFSTALTDSYDFGTNIRVNDNPAGTSFESVYSSGGHSMAARGDTVYLAWRSDRNPRSTIYFDKSINGGQTWGTDVRITDSDSGAIMPALAVGQDGTIYVSWTDFRDASGYRHIYFAKSTNGGTSFLPSVRVSAESGEMPQAFSSIAVNDSNYVFIAYHDWRNYITNALDIYCSRSIDGGNSFQPAARVDDCTDSIDQKDPCIASGKDNFICLTWQDRRNSVLGGSTRNRYDVYSSVSLDYGQTFNANIRVNERALTDSMDRWASSVSIDNSNRVYVAFEDWRNINEDIYFTKSTDSGQSFISPNINLIDVAGQSYYQGYSSLCCDDSGGVYCAWEDIRNDYNNARQIYFGFSKNYGDSFSYNIHVDDRPLDDSAWLWVPTICANKTGKIFAAWEDGRNKITGTKYDIYTTVGMFVNGVAGNPAPNTMPGLQSLKMYPNPFKRRTTISYQLPSPSLVKLTVYNIAGQLVRTLVGEFHIAGSYRVGWNGLDDSGNNVSSGIYLVCLRANGKTTSEKITLIR